MGTVPRRVLVIAAGMLAVTSCAGGDSTSGAVVSEPVGAEPPPVTSPPPSTAATPSPATTTADTVPDTTVPDTTAAPPPTTAPATTSTTLDPASITTWTRPDLLVTSWISTANGVAVYEGLVDAALRPETVDGPAYYAGTLVLVGVDVRTGQELFRRPVDPLYRVPGVVERPFVDSETDTHLWVDATTGELIADDLRTGERRWSAETGAWNGVVLFDCGSSVCATGSFGGVDEFDRTTGELIGSHESYGRLVLMRPDLFVKAAVPSPEGAAEPIMNLSAYTDGGATTAWTTRGLEFEALLGHGVTPNSGWSFSSDGTDTTGVGYLGGILPAGYGSLYSSLADFPELVDLPIGGIVGFDMQTGDLTWGVPDAAMLRNDGEHVIGAVRASTVVDVDAGTVTYLIDALTSWDRVTGDVTWSVELGSTDLTDVTVDIVGDIVVVTTPTATVVLDAETGAQVADTSGVLTTCSSSLARRVSIDLRSYARAPWGNPCQLDGTVVDPLQVLQQGRPIPNTMLDAGDGWWLWVDADGILHGAGPGG